MDRIKAYYDNDRFFPLLVKELSGYAIFLMTTDGLIASWNEGAELIKGYKEDEVLGHHFRMLFPERFQKEKYPETEIQKAIENGRFENQEWRIRKSGEEFWAKVVLTPLYDDNKKLLGFAKITQDLSKEKATEEALKKKSEEIRHQKEFGDAILETITEGIAVLNDECTIVNSNGVFDKLFSLEDGNSVGKKISEIHPRWNEEDTLKLISDLIKSEKYFKNKELEFLVNDELRIYSISSRLIYHNQNKDLKVLLTVDDVTIIKQVETAKADLVSFVSHELRTPLTNIKAYVQLMMSCRESKRDCDYDKYLKKTLLFADTLNKMIQEFHESNIAEAGKIQIEKTKFRLEDLVIDTIEGIQLTYPQQVIKKQGKADVMVYADPMRITQVITNFLTNAIKYSDGREVIVDLLVRKDNVQVAVLDSGPGISEEDRKKLFSRYYRSKKTLRKEGLGMGLFLVKTIVNAHKGQVGVESEPGKGSTFYFRLPFADDDSNKKG